MTEKIDYNTKEELEDLILEIDVILETGGVVGTAMFATLAELVKLKKSEQPRSAT
ncbi:hypothetical protein [Flexibacterium corallicola]|uniref:hypothetical protein n=1 Tax=Flexibacterium corallicola TaxID=3037259 RepID=UPI00286EC1C9|nr:hypothetical protein [Pseudovibrio sp. M1P-2-3]